MRKRVIRVFDQQLDTTGATALGPRLGDRLVEHIFAVEQADLGLIGKRTAKHLEDLLGEYDELGLFVEVTDVSSASAVTFDLYVDTSGDGFNWLPARNQVNQTPPFHTGVGTGDITLSVSTSSPGVGWFVMAATGVTRATGTPVAAGPLLHFVRLFMKISSGTAQVRVHAFQRDSK